MKLIEISPIKVQTIQSVDQANMVDNDRKTMENNGKQWTGSKQGDTMISETLCLENVCAFCINQQCIIGLMSFNSIG